MTKAPQFKLTNYSAGFYPLVVNVRFAAAATNVASGMSLGVVDDGRNCSLNTHLRIAADGTSGAQSSLDIFLTSIWFKRQAFSDRFSYR
jgi:hypothetical protein